MLLIKCFGVVLLAECFTGIGGIKNTKDPMMADNDNISTSRRAKTLSFFPTESTNNEITAPDEDRYQSPEESDIIGRGSFKFDEHQQPSSVEAKQNLDFPYFNTGEYYNDNSYQNYVNSPVIKGPPVPYRRPPQPQPPQSMQTQQQSNYAQYFDYPNFKRPQQPQKYGPQQPSNQYYQGNVATYRPVPTASYNQPNYAADFNNYDTGNPITSFISNLGQGASDLFYGARPAQGGLSSSQQQFNGPNPSANLNSNGPLGQFGKAVEEITRHDDLQCIPKIICQMVGGQRRQNSLSPLLGSPVFSSLISAVPSTSTGLVYGRAALLGYTAGESRCDGAYPKCPRNEDNLLYYLNNHRGGFFRFFNGGAAYGDGEPVGNGQQSFNYQNYNQGTNINQASNYNQQQNYDQNQNYNQQYQAQQQGTTATNLAFLSGLADAINQGGGINLSNLGANGGVLGNLASLVGGMTGGSVANIASMFGGQAGTLQNDGAAFNVGDIFSNLLTGFVGNRFSSRRISKRSVDTEIAADITSVTKPLMTVDKELKYLKQTDVKKRNLNSEIKIEYEEEKGADDDDNKEEILAEDDDEELIASHEKINDEPEGRIVNLKEPILANNVLFPTNIARPLRVRGEKMVKFTDVNKGITNAQTGDVFVFQSDYSSSNDHSNVIVKFPHNIIDLKPLRNSKKIKFGLSPTSSDHVFVERNDHRIKMVFPDRTGTGNLRFDIEDFDKVTKTPPLRNGRILFGQKHHQPNDQTNGDSNREHFYGVGGSEYGTYINDDKNPQNIVNRYQESTTFSPDRYSIVNYQNNKYGNENYDYNSQNSNSNYYQKPLLSHNINYSSNQQNADQNVYVTNSKGVVEYYINAAGKKVYI